MFDNELERSINTAINEARTKHHAQVTLELVLLSLLSNPSALSALISCNADVNRLRNNVSTYIQKNIKPSFRKLDNEQTEFSAETQHVIQQAVHQARAVGCQEASGAHVIAAIFCEPRSKSASFLAQENITQSSIINYITRINSEHTTQQPPKRHSSSDSFLQNNADEKDGDDNDPLLLYTSNLNSRTLSGQIDPLIGRKDEVQRTLQVLCRRNKNNPLLVGEAGVGKTAIAEGLAQLIIERKVPENMHNSVIYSLDMGLLLAGTKYRGDLEQRLKDVLNRLSEEQGAILYIDEIHTIIGAGATTGSNVDVANLIKPMLASGKLTCIGSTTYEEYRRIFEKDHALDRRFQKIDVQEPTIEQTIEILQGLRNRFELHHQVKFTDEALEGAARLSERYLSDRHLPDKAIDLIDEVGAYQFLLPRHERKQNIGLADIEHMVAKIARIPEKTVSATDTDILKNLCHDLQNSIFGQDDAIATLSAAVKMSRSGLRDTEKPIGSFLLIGPTGVGKTEVCRQLAKKLGVELIRFDMSEYMESHSVSRLIGSPPGYVGYEEGGVLTEAITKTPHAILLLDEIEKAHPDIYNLLLQVMDHGTLTDMNGRNADFRHAMIVMTSNVGASDLEKGTIGFTNEASPNDLTPSINRVFSPEFRNRLDAIIQFNSITDATMLSIVGKFINELEIQLKKHHVTIEVDDAARSWLAINGYDKNMGARPLDRLIQNQIKKPLSDELLFGTLRKGGHVKVTARNGVIKFIINDMLSSDNTKITQEK